MSKWLLLYKGDFTRNLNGAEIRYIKIAEQLALAGNEVTIAGVRGHQRGDVKFVAVNQIISLIRAFSGADTIMIHGGGPFILLLVLFSKIIGTRILLDNYAPHWIELLSVTQRDSRSLRTTMKIAFNLFRTLFGTIVCDTVIAANKRQQDLYRGLAASSGNLHLIDKIQILSYGADSVVETKTRSHLRSLSQNRVSDSNILIGWIGSLWDWFDYKTIIDAVAAVANNNDEIKLVFFGVDEHKENEVKQYIATIGADVSSNFLFLPWIDYENRLAVWSGLDAGIVWANPSIENDYAARTRNYDCISARLPIIQNWDDYWGPIIKEHNIGITTSEQDLERAMADFVANKQRIAEYSENIATLYDEYSWQRTTANLLSLAMTAKTRPSYTSIMSLIILGPLLLLNVVVNK